MSADDLHLTFHGDTRELLRLPETNGTVVYALNRRASIKDIIEAIGVPHTEVGRIVAGENELGFDYIVQEGERFDIFPQTGDIPVTEPTVLRPEPLPEPKFMVDVNVLKLARNLRLLGLDTTTVTGGTLVETARAAEKARRILLTRNRDLLKVALLSFGQLLRSEDHRRQLDEVINRYNLHSRLHPFLRCLRCNDILTPVAKEKVMDRLEPLTKKYYHHFKVCNSCGRIYWRGSHHQRMQDLIDSSLQ